MTKPTVPEVLPLLLAYVRKPGNVCGGSLHIVLDDGNLEDASVAFCLERARQEGDEDGVALAELLARMSRTQRGKLCALKSTAVARRAPDGRDERGDVVPEKLR